ncbi:MAG: hypothetical protein KAI14_01050 [Dehalococcoidales bacterium]|nr:hypothetical protein [Dehalococcoidales bacterium]
MVVAIKSDHKYRLRLDIVTNYGLVLPPKQQLQKQLEDLRAMREMAMSVRGSNTGISRA